MSVSKDPKMALGQHPVETLDVTFKSLGLSKPILDSINAIGFEKPTPIQAAVLEKALAGHDIVGLAQTGSGKTAAFCLPIANKLIHGGGTRALILCPTREIALQTQAFLDIFGKHHQLTTCCVIGGVRMGPQIREIKNKPDIIIATPGRLNDHLERGLISFHELEFLVLDEADHMFDMGFFVQIRKILRKLPKKRQTLMFSATMPDSIAQLVAQHMNEPETINILPSAKVASGIQHRLYMVDQSDKEDCLVALLKQELVSTLIFTRTKMDANWIYKLLKEEKHPVGILHSDRTQSERTKTLQSFRDGKYKILVATDIVSRGIDIPNMEHVINFDIPSTVDEYIHRSGRTARAGSTGTASTICTWQDKPMIKEIEAVLGNEIPRCTIAGVKPYKELNKGIKKPNPGKKWGR